jgi:hypothetical protein
VPTISPLFCGLFAGGKPLPALRAFELVKVDAANLIRRNRVPALRADRIERCLNFSEIDFRLAGYLPTLAFDG